MNALERNLLDAVASPVFLLALDKGDDPVFCAWNKAAALMNRIEAADAIGKTAAQVFPGRIGRMAAERHRAAARSGKTVSYELTLPVPSGERQIRTTLEPMLDADGTVQHLVGTTIDVTEAHHNNLSRIRRTVDVSTIADEMEQFVAMAAHDLRTPMRNVQILADRLRKDFKDLGDGKLELIDLLEEVGIKATSLISDVLAYARTTIDTERSQTFEFSELVEDVAAVIDPQEVHRIESTNARVRADKTVLQIVLRNLMDNAIKHSEKESVAISLSLRPGPDEQIECQICDNGKGFADPAVAFLTGGVFRQGTGFGLLGIKRLILTRGGTISAAHPEEGTGTIVTLTLPGEVLQLL